MTRAEFEAMILEAISDTGSLHTLGAENGVEIDSSGPQGGNTMRVEGYYRANGARSYFQATLTVALEEFSPVWDDEEA